MRSAAQIRSYSVLALAVVASTSGWAATPEEIFARVSRSVVVVESLNTKGQPIAFGSGAVVAQGLVVTNFHVMKRGVKFRARTEDGVRSARVASADAKHGRTPYSNTPASCSSASSSDEFSASSLGVVLEVVQLDRLSLRTPVSQSDSRMAFKRSTVRSRSAPPPLLP